MRTWYEDETYSTIDTGVEQVMSYLMEVKCNINESETVWGLVN